MICRKVKLVNAIGTTEVGAPPIYQKDPEDWEYFHYHPDHKGIEFRPMGDGTYDMVIVRHALTDQFHATFWTFPDLDEYSMNDLYTKHPTKPNLWLYVGRTDDIIVLSNREKLNPTSMEVTFRDHLSVKGALVVGHARFAPGAIIELKDEAATSMVTHREKAQFVGEEIWEFAARANKTAPAHAQLLQDEIILSNPMKLFLRAAKGTLQRQATVKLYADEIEELYRWSEDEESVVDLPKIDVRQDGEGLKEKIGGLVCKVLGLTSVEHDQDLFNSGMDSLHVMTLVKRLKASMVGVPQEQINTRLVYSNPSITALAGALN
jgi:aryl carrier-like protein